MTFLSFDRVDRTYTGKSALEDVSLNLSPGETFGLIGLNGAGKTTLLKCLLDLQRPDRGTITINTRSGVTPSAREDVFFLSEKFTPPDYMTGRLYLRYVNDAHRHDRLDKPALERRAHELCARLELEADSLERIVRTYSKGMLQKLGLIGCLLSDKTVLIMDEPMSGLDPRARMLFREAMQDLKNSGRTILLSTHIIADIEALCDRVGILHHGRLLFTGTPEECCRRYDADNLEAAFLKSIQ